MDIKELGRMVEKLNHNTRLASGVSVKDSINAICDHLGISLSESSSSNPNRIVTIWKDGKETHRTD